MVVGFVLVSVAPGHEHEVYKGIMGTKGVVEATPLFGEYDFIVKLDVATVDKLGEVVVGHLRRIDGVRETKTLTATRL